MLARMQKRKEKESNPSLAQSPMIADVSLMPKQSWESKDESQKCTSTESTKKEDCCDSFSCIFRFNTAKKKDIPQVRTVSH